MPKLSKLEVFYYLFAFALITGVCFWFFRLYAPEFEPIANRLKNLNNDLKPDLITLYADSANKRWDRFEDILNVQLPCRSRKGKILEPCLTKNIDFVISYLESHTLRAKVENGKIDEKVTKDYEQIIQGIPLQKMLK